MSGARQQLPGLDRLNDSVSYTAAERVRAGFDVMSATFDGCGGGLNDVGELLRLLAGAIDAVAGVASKHAGERERAGSVEPPADVVVDASIRRYVAERRAVLSVACCGAIDVGVAVAAVLVGVLQPQRVSYAASVPRGTSDAVAADASRTGHRELNGDHARDDDRPADRTDENISKRLDRSPCGKNGIEHRLRVSWPAVVVAASYTFRIIGVLADGTEVDAAQLAWLQRNLDGRVDDVRAVAKTDGPTRQCTSCGRFDPATMPVRRPGERR